MKNWYALYTRPRWEKKVAVSLSKKKIENYCPVNKVVSQWSDRRKVIERPLFTSYVFIYVTKLELWETTKVDGVINPVYWLGKPAVIKDMEIEMIKRFLSEHRIVELSRTPVNINDMVKIVNGPLMEKEGSVLEVTNNKIKLILPSLGYSITAEVPMENVVICAPRQNSLISSVNATIS